MKAKLKMIIISLFLVSILILSGCDAPTGEVISGEVPDNILNENTGGNIIDITEQEISDEENKLKNEIENSKIESIEKLVEDEIPIEIDNIEPAYPTTEDVNLLDITLDDDFDFGKIIDIYEGDTHYIDIDGVKQKLKLLKVLKNGNVMFEFRGQDTDFLETGDVIRLDRAHSIEIGAGLYNDPWNKMPSLAELIYTREILESYDEFLVEEDIDNIEFYSSSKSGNTYTAKYEYDITVQVRTDYDFLNKHQYESNLYLYDGNDYIYRETDNLGNIDEIAWLSEDGYGIIINTKSDPIIERYLKKHPTALTTDMYCTYEVKMIEGDSRSFEINNEIIEIEDVIYVDGDDNFKFKINGEFTSRFDIEEQIEITSSIKLVAKEVWPNYDETDDRIRFCFIYDEK